MTRIGSLGPVFLGPSGIITAANPNFAKMFLKGWRKVLCKHRPYNKKESMSRAGQIILPNETLQNCCATHVWWFIYYIEVDGGDINVHIWSEKGKEQAKLGQTLKFHFLKVPVLSSIVLQSQKRTFCRRTIKRPNNCGSKSEAICLTCFGLFHRQKKILLWNFIHLLFCI